LTFADAKQRFSSRVADYARYRPGYPAALLDLLREECGLRAEQVIADVGSGTGLLSKLFLENGNRVFGVEPNPDMRAAGEEFLAAFSNFLSVDGSAEATSLPGSAVDFITAGQAFHWFDPVAARQEFARILRPEGWGVVVWNERDLDRTAFAREYEDLLVHFGTDYRRVKEAYPGGEDIRSFFLGNKFVARELPNFQEFGFEELAGRLRSSSYAPLPDDPNFAPMMEALGKIFRAHSVKGRVRMEYSTRIYFGRLERA
jgi:SAM-dependent methyltransferase